jgi:hypothetical protein
METNPSALEKAPVNTWNKGATLIAMVKNVKPTATIPRTARITKIKPIATTGPLIIGGRFSWE